MSCPLKTYFPFLDYQFVRTFFTFLAAFFAYFKGFFDYFDIGLGCGGGPVFLMLSSVLFGGYVISRKIASNNAATISAIETHLPKVGKAIKKD